MRKGLRSLDNYRQPNRQRQIAERHRAGQEQRQRRVESGPGDVRVPAQRRIHARAKQPDLQADDEDQDIDQPDREDVGLCRVRLAESLSGSGHGGSGGVLVVHRWHHEDVVAADFEFELWQRALRRALERCAGARVEPAIVAGAFNLSLFRLVKHRAGKMRALLLEGTPFVIAKIDQDVRQRAARKRERMGAADRHVLFLADEMLAGDWRMRERACHAPPPTRCRRQGRRRPQEGISQIRAATRAGPRRGRWGNRRPTRGFGGRGASISLFIASIHHEFGAAFGHHDVDFGFHGLLAKAKRVHRRAVRTQLAHFLARAVPERPAGADGGAHRLLARAGAVVAHVALHHELHRLGLLRHAKRAGIDAVRAGDAARGVGAVDDAELVFLIASAGQTLAHAGIFAVHADLHARFAGCR